ncbi:MAG: Gfo/Idh/MocA family oxidoreductase [Candidatus Latescibacteria bacterium]|jgi:predicted dehydrogenase|nr:Gfo/Idh/MocA family oxidoreductase [Candidatus Latescibacterota bacterium]
MALRFGIIGTGIMGKAGGRILQLVDDLDVVALADVSEKSLAAAAEELGVDTTYSSYEEMLDKANLDAVYVATPDWFHRDPCIAALEAGCHVIVEKPMTTVQEEAEEILKVVDKTGKKFQINFNHRWLSAYHKIKAMIDDGDLGEPVIGYARKNNPVLVPTSMLASWAEDSSPAWFMSSHDIDLMVWWFGAIPTEVYAKGIKRVLKSKGMDTWDGIQSLVTFDGGQFATFEAAWIYPNTSPYMPDSYMEVIGTNGTTQIDRQAEAIDAILDEKFTCPRTFLNYKVFDQWVGAMPSSIRSFVHACRTGADTVVNEREGLKSTAILDAIHRSLESGKPESIKLNL